jgi:hypothetical protein
VPPSGLLGRWLLSQGKPLRLRPPRVALLPQFCNGGPKVVEPLLSYGCSLPRLRKGRGISLRWSISLWLSILINVMLRSIIASIDAVCCGRITDRHGTVLQRDVLIL